MYKLGPEASDIAVLPMITPSFLVPAWAHPDGGLLGKVVQERFLLH